MGKHKGRTINKSRTLTKREKSVAHFHLLPISPRTPPPHNGLYKEPTKRILTYLLINA